MLFNSFIFFIFLAVVLPTFYLLPKNNHKKLFLLLMSYVFYGYWDWRFCGLILLSTIVDYTIGLKLDKSFQPRKRKILLFISVFVNLSILGFFKYFNFFVDSFEQLAIASGLQLDFLHLNILLPVGISFYTFQTMSYTIDIYRKKLHATRSFLDFSLFVAFFPQLVAGPIERAKNLLPQISVLKKASKEQIQKGIHLIVLGLFKKVIIGDTAGRIVDHIFAQPEYYASGELLMALFLFAFQIYADFSGYSSIARGVAKLLGIELMKNFEQPYLSQNITEFWRRWHISLSSWLKDYLYVSLGGNRKGNSRTYVNLMITMLLGGLWHGASWNFVIWGGIHGLYLAIHKVILNGRKVNDRYEYDNLFGLLKFLANVTLTFLLVLLTWLFFRLTTLDAVFLFFEKMIIWESSDFPLRIFKITFFYAFMVFMIDGFQYFYKKHTVLLKIELKPVRYAFLFVMFSVTLLYMFQAEPMPFIYFQF